MVKATAASPAFEAGLRRIDGAQVVLIPAEMELEGDTVSIRRDGTRLIIEPIGSRKSLLGVLEELQPLGEGEEFPDLHNP